MQVDEATTGTGSPRPAPPVSEATIRVLAEFAGLPLTADRNPAVLTQWQRIAASLAALESLDVSECEPAIVFHAAWEE